MEKCRTTNPTSTTAKSVPKREDNLIASELEEEFRIMGKLVIHLVEDLTV
jgi:hypothetical protein